QDHQGIPDSVRIEGPERTPVSQGVRRDSPHGVRYRRGAGGRAGGGSRYHRRSNGRRSGSGSACGSGRRTRRRNGRPRSALPTGNRFRTGFGARGISETVMAQERLQKILSQAGVASRRQAEKIMLEGRVTVNGSIVTELGSKADLESD